MKALGLDEQYHNWKITGHIPKNNDGRGRSEYHLRARSLLKKIFPTCQILEEIPAPVRKGQVLYLDFFLPLHNLCIEVHGEQHYKFIPFYHGSSLGFAKSKKRDREKLEWCKINGIVVVEFPYNEDDNDWERRIKNR